MIGKFLQEEENQTGEGVQKTPDHSAEEEISAGVLDLPGSRPADSVSPADSAGKESATAPVFRDAGDLIEPVPLPENQMTSPDDQIPVPENHTAAQEIQTPAPENQTPAPETAPAEANTEIYQETPAENIRRTGLAWSAATVLFGSVVFMLVLGWFFDLIFGSSPWGMVGGIVLGAIIGFIQFFRITSQIFKKDENSSIGLLKDDN
jgi:F0F1-type ATP synthase assembly protein I